MGEQKKKKRRRIGPKFIDNLDTFKLSGTSPVSRNRFCNFVNGHCAPSIWQIGLLVFDH